MLALIARFMTLPDKQQLHGFLRSQPDTTSTMFLLWLAEKEAQAVGEQKRVLAGICEELVVFSEQLATERMDQLYVSTLAALSAGQADPAAGALALASDPGAYQQQLAEAVTGVPVVREGYDTAYDMLLQVAPPVALTPEGVRQGHELAKDLAGELKTRRKRSVASIIGRAQLTPEQADRLKAGSNASRILDMLLTLPSTADRLACLPDCFTPPEPQPELEPNQQHQQPTAGPAPASPHSSSSGGLPTASGAPATPSAASGQGSGAGEQEEAGAETEELWCTPAQLLSEIESRLQRMEGRGPRPPAEMAAAHAALLGPGLGGGLVGEALGRELGALREAVREQWLEAMGQQGQQGAGASVEGQRL